MFAIFFLCCWCLAISQQDSFKYTRADIRGVTIPRLKQIIDRENRSYDAFQYPHYRQEYEDLILSIPVDVASDHEPNINDPRFRVEFPDDEILDSNDDILLANNDIIDLSHDDLMDVDQGDSDHQVNDANNRQDQQNDGNNVQNNVQNMDQDGEDAQPANVHPANVQPVHVQPVNVQPVNAQPVNDDDDDDILEDMSHQNQPEIVIFMKEINLSQHTQILLENGFIDCGDINECTEQDLDDYGICLPGHKKRILRKAKEKLAAIAAAAVAAANGGQIAGGNVNVPIAGGNVGGQIAGGNVNAPIAGGNVNVPVAGGNGNGVNPGAGANGQPTPAPAALVFDWKGAAYQAVLMKGGRTAGECRKKIVGMVKARRFDCIMYEKDAMGRLKHSGHKVTKRTLKKLEKYGLVRLTDVYDPRCLLRRGRGGSQYWGCKVWRQGPSVAHDSADIDGQNALRNFMKRYKKYIPWNNYALACGDVRRCCELRLFDWNDGNDEEENLENDNDEEKEAED